MQPHARHLLGSSALACPALLRLPEALGHEQVDARDMVVEATHPVYGTVQLVNNATGFSGAQDATAPPLYSEHSREILRDVLNYELEHVDSLIRSGVVLEGSHDES